jgi:hypothetical protein
MKISGAGISLIRRALKESADENHDSIISALVHAVHLQRSEAGYSDARAYPFVTALTLLRWGTAKQGRMEQWSAMVQGLGYRDSEDILEAYLRRLDKVHREDERGLITVAELFDETVEIWKHFLADTAN